MSWVDYLDLTLQSRGEEAGYFDMPFKGFSIGYRGNGEAYTIRFDTLFDRFTLFVYDSFVYPSDIYWRVVSHH